MEELNCRMTNLELMRAATNVSDIYNANLRAASMAINEMMQSSERALMESIRAATSISSMYNTKLKAATMAINEMIQDNRRALVESMRAATSISDIYNTNLRAATMAINEMMQSSERALMESIRAATSVSNMYNANIERLRALTVEATIYNLDLNEIDVIDLSNESKTSVFNKNKLIVGEFIKRQVPKVLNIFTLEKFKGDLESNIRGFIIGLLVNSIGATGVSANNFIKFEESERYISIQYDGETIQALKSKELMKHLENIKKEIELNMIKDF